MIVKTKNDMDRAAVGGVVAGLAAGSFLTLVMTAVSWANGRDVWYGIKGAAAPLLGERAMLPGFDFGPVALGMLAHLRPRLAAPIVGTTGVLYTIPSLALFTVLVPWTGIGRTPVLVGLVVYALLVLVRNVLVGLGGVDESVRDAARGLGYGRLRLLLTVELPNALPAIVTGIRLATVTTVALVTVGVVVGCRVGRHGSSLRAGSLRP